MRPIVPNDLHDLEIIFEYMLQIALFHNRNRLHDNGLYHTEGYPAQTKSKTCCADSSQVGWIIVSCATEMQAYYHVPCFAHTDLRILQNIKSCGLSVPRFHESPSPTAPAANPSNTRRVSVVVRRTTTLTRVTLKV